MDGYGDPIPPGHGEPEPTHTGSSNVYGDEWQFDPTPSSPYEWLDPFRDHEF